MVFVLPEAVVLLKVLSSRQGQINLRPRFIMRLLGRTKLEKCLDLAG